VIFVCEWALSLIELIKHIIKRLAVFEVLAEVSNDAILASSFQMEIDPTNKNFFWRDFHQIS